MLSLAYLRDNRDEVINRLKVRNLDATETVEKIIGADADRRRLQKSLDDNLAQANGLAKQIGQLFREGKKDEAEAMKAQTADLKEAEKTLREELAAAELQVNNLLVTLPNMPHASVPQGKTPEDNEVVLEEGTQAQLHESAMPHWELAKKYDLIDFELGVKITGAGFPVYKGKGARLQRALIHYFLDSANRAGYTEYEPPILINADSGYGTGQLPDKEGQMYFVTEDNLYLIPTAEVPLTNLYRDVILKEEDFPIKMTGYTPCFRREAGSYGKDVRGLNRLHQFDKVEIVHIEHPDKSYETLDRKSVV